MTTLNIPEKEVRPKRRLGPPKTDIVSFIDPISISISLKWHIPKLHCLQPIHNLNYGNYTYIKKMFALFFSPKKVK